MANVVVVNTDANLSGNTILTEENNYTITGIYTFTTSPVISANLSFKSGTAFTGMFDHAMTADRTVTVPDATDTLVMLAETQTLTNKTLTSPTLTTPALGTPASGVLTNCTGLPITGITASTSAEFATLCSDETGSGALVFATSPTLVTPALGTPASGVLTNTTGLPISSGVSGLGAGVATFLATPSSANLITAVTDETGTGALVFATSPTLVTPALGTPASGVLTNCTGLPVTGLANGTDGELITWSATGVAETVAVGTATHVLTSNGVGAAPTFQAPSGTGDLLADGSVPLTANWDVGAFTITGTQFISDIAIGTAPFVVTSTTVVANLNADLLDGNEAAAFATASHNHAASDVNSGTLAHERGGLEADVSAYDGLVHITGGVTSAAGPGTSGQVLTSNGAGAAPTMQTLAASPITSYAVTLADVENTTSKTAFASATVGDMGDGDIFIFLLEFELSNEKGSTGNITFELDWNGTAFAWATNSYAVYNGSGVDGRIHYEVRCLRDGANLYISKSPGDQSSREWSYFTDDYMLSGAVLGHSSIAPSFASGTVAMKATLSAADATFSLKGKTGTRFLRISS